MSTRAPVLAVEPSRMRRHTSRPSTFGKREVEAHEVVLGVRELLERLLAVVGDVDGVALAAQAAGDGLGEVDLVLDHQDPHRRQP